MSLKNNTDFAYRLMQKFSKEDNMLYSINITKHEHNVFMNHRTESIKSLKEYLKILENSELNQKNDWLLKTISKLILIKQTRPKRLRYNII